MHHGADFKIEVFDANKDKPVGCTLLSTQGLLQWQRDELEKEGEITITSTLTQKTMKAFPRKIRFWGHYNRTSPLEQMTSQHPLEFQTIFQLEATNVSPETGSDNTIEIKEVRDAIENTLSSIHPDSFQLDFFSLWWRVSTCCFLVRG